MLLLILFFCSIVQAEKESSFEFQADVSKVMNILINSLYSNKDIFLRELISNAADALSKVRFLSLTNRSILGTGDGSKLDIRIIVDEEGKTITIIDRGIGMNREELIQNLGTIAHSGTQRFLDGVSNGTEAVDVIGQFGVGFYSSFLVAEKVKVTSKRIGDKQHTWTSNNAQSFEVAEDKSGIDLVRGTKIVLYLRDGAYANTTRIRDMAVHFSEFVDFPIYVRVKQDSAEASKKKKQSEDNEDEDDEEEKKDREPSYIGDDGTVYDFVHVNPQKAIWLREQKTITDDDYIHFYRSISRDYKETPVYWSHFTAEGDVEFKSILYIPGTPPPMESTRQTALRLYVHRVLIAEDFDEFLPRYLSFIRGIIDSDDVQLNVSREMLQESKTLRAIGKKIVRKIIQMMVDMAEKNKADGDPTYQNFYRLYHRFIKIGVAEDIPNRRRLASLLRFNTTKSERTPISLDDYISRMRPGQSEFFYIAGDPATSNIMQSPFLIPYRRRGTEVLFLSDPIDEMIIRDMREYENKVFTCITQVEKKSLKTESEYEREKLKTWKKRFKPLANFFKEVLGNKVERVEVSTRLAADPRTPCVLSHVEGSASANMERYTRQQNRVDPRVNVYESRKVLEINPTNNLVKRMNVAVQQCEEDEVEGFDLEDDEDGAKGGGAGTDETRLKRAENKQKLETMALLLYDTAIFESGYIIGDSNEYAERVFDVLTRMTGLPNAPVEDEEALLRRLRARDSDDEDEEEDDVKSKKSKGGKGKKAADGDGDDEEDEDDGTGSKRKKGKKGGKDGEKKKKKEKKVKADEDDEVDGDDAEVGISKKDRLEADALRAKQKQERQEREKALEQEEKGDKAKETQEAERQKAAQRKREADEERMRKAEEKAQEQEQREHKERKGKKKEKNKDGGKDMKESDKEVADDL